MAKKKQREPDPSDLTAEWRLSVAATLGSDVRTKGILLEVRANLPKAVRKEVDLEGGLLVLRMASSEGVAFRAAASRIEKVLATIEDQPVIPREIEDILGISASLRHKWLKDGRLQSIGTRTVRLAGRARKITFHVFDPRYVEDLHDRDQVSTWREEDVIAAAENRKRASANAAMLRAAKKAAKAKEAEGLSDEPAERTRTGLKNWDDFDLDGLLR